jgi:hypothetical protein
MGFSLKTNCKYSLFQHFINPNHLPLIQGLPNNSNPPLIRLPTPILTPHYYLVMVNALRYQLSAIGTIPLLTRARAKHLLAPTVVDLHFVVGDVQAFGTELVVEIWRNARGEGVGNMNNGGLLKADAGGAAEGFFTKAFGPDVVAELIHGIPQVLI